MPKKIKINIEKGSISVYAIATIFCFIFILSGVFTSSSSIRKNQLKTLLKIKEIYASQIDKADEIAEKRRLDSQKVANNLGIVISTTENKDLTDNYGNKITIPAGFHIVTTTEDSTVEYSYSEDGIPAVQDGIVVADGDGNQFVWVPVGTINNKADDPNGVTTAITLARYTFNIGNYNSITKKYDGDGSIVSTVTDGDTAIETYFKELASSTYGNTTAKNLGEFIIKAKTNGGYYIARYEASNNNGVVESKSNVTVWNNITQPDAATASRAMYVENNDFVSDLVNSYAWDTAIVFIQTYGDSDYSMQTSLNNDLANTGTRDDGTTDKVCNIYDMASNTFEWTTDTSTYTNTPCVRRGGSYYDTYYCASLRGSYATSFSNSTFSFRPILYVT